jgi:Cu/Ag efflux protein CusF
VFVKVPDDVLAPDFKAGDEIALVVTVDADGNFTLVKAENESSDDDDGDGVDIDGQKFAVAGILASMDDGKVTVNFDGNEHRPFTCKVPDGFDLSGFAVGNRVLMGCKYNDGNPVLIGLQKKDATPEYIEARGKITDLGDAGITVTPDGHDPVTCAVPDETDLSDYAVGDPVVIWCKQVEGAWTLKGIKLITADPPPAEYLYAAGTITVLDEGTITVQGEHEVSCDIPDGFDLTGYAVGSKVGMYCMQVDGAWTLKALKKLDAPPPPTFVYGTGSITALGDGSITVQGDGEPVTCAVREDADLSDFAVGDHVAMKCVHTDAGLKLVQLESETASYTAP